MIVRSTFPTADAPNSARLAIVGEAPGLEESSWLTCACGRSWAGESWSHGTLVKRPNCPWCQRVGELTPTPFVGPSGYSLNERLREAGFDRRFAFVGNVLNFKPDGPLNAESWQRLAMRGGLDVCLRLLADELNEFKPHCVLLLGGISLWAFHPDRGTDPWSKDSPSISDWRGSILLGELPGGHWRGKCVVCYHPAFVLRAPDEMPWLRFDVARAVAEAAFPEVNAPVYEYDPNPKAGCVIAELVRLADQGHDGVGYDIEGYPYSGVTDYSFALTPTRALWVPFKHADGSPWWSPSDEQLIWQATRAVLESDRVQKVLANALYEMLVLKTAHDITLRGVADDVMLLMWEMYSELNNRLSIIASLFTRQAFWKESRGSEDDAQRALYNVTDSCVTLQCWQAMLAPEAKHLTPAQLVHCRWNLAMLPATLDLELAGFKFDEPARQRLLADLDTQVCCANAELDQLAGIPPLPSLPEVARIVCRKVALRKVRDWGDVVTWAKPSWREDAPRIAELCARGGPSPVPAVPPEAETLVLASDDEEAGDENAPF